MPTIISKSEFANRLGVSPARVSQMIKERKIDGAALVGTGRSAKINLEEAREQVRVRTDLGQALGNGANTKVLPLDSDDAQTVELVDGDEPRQSQRPTPKTREQEIREAHEMLKLRAARRKDVREQEEEMLHRGVLMKTDDAVLEMQAIVGLVYDILSGHPDRLGDLLAAEFEITDKRRLIFFLRNNYRELKTHISEEMARRAENEPDNVSADLLQTGINGDEDVGESSEVALPDRSTEIQAANEGGPQ